MFYNLLIDLVTSKLLGRKLILTHGSDPDGLISGAIALRKFRNASVYFAEPSDIQKHRSKLIGIVKWDLVADLPCVDKAKLWVDHHATNRPCVKNHLFDPKAPCAAILVLKALKMENDMVASTLAQIAVQTDTAQIREEKAWDVYDAVKGADEEGRRLIVKLMARDGLSFLEDDEVKKYILKGRSRRVNTKRVSKVVPDAKNILIYIDKTGVVSARGLIFQLESRGYEYIFTARRKDSDSWSISIGSGSKDVDCSKIAVSLGGGGHKHAAGATIKAKNIDEVSKILERSIKSEIKLVKLSKLLKKVEVST